MKTADISNEIKRVTLVSLSLNLSLSILKMTTGMLFYSSGLFVDGVHSLSDALTDLFVLFISKFSSEAPDAEHPYGHGRFETLGTTVLGCLLISVGIIIGYESSFNLMHGVRASIPNIYSFIVILISILSNEWLFRYTLKAGKKVNSKLLIANAWHSRSDSLSSIAVLIGLVFTQLGFLWMDSVIAIVVGVMICKVGWSFLWDSINELVDTSLDKDIVSSIGDAILNVDGVISFHDLRSRKMGSKAILDINLQVDKNISVSEGHEISTFVSEKLKDEYSFIADVITHTDIEDDRGEGYEFFHKKRTILPLRSEVERKLKELNISWIRLTLHYGEDSISVDLIMNSEDKDKKEIFRKKMSSISYIEDVNFLLKL